jgi:hypothetical protein
MTPKAWADLQGQIVKDRALNDWHVKHADWATKHAVPRHEGRAAAYGDVLDKMDFLLRLPIVPLADAWTELHAYVKEQRGIYDEQAADHGEMTGHEAQEERAYGRVEAYDEVLAYMDSAEKEAGR